MKTGKDKVLSVIGMVLAVAFVGACSSPTDSSTTAAVVATTAAVAVTGPANNLGVASTFALYGGAAGMTNAGTETVITGDIATIAAATLITGFHKGLTKYTETTSNRGAVSGTVYSGTGSTAEQTLVAQAALDIKAAYDDLAARKNGTDPGAGQLGGLTLASGVYTAAGGSFTLSGSDLTLDAKGNANAVWIFQTATFLTIGIPANPRSVLLINGAQAKNVYWQVGTSATVNGAPGGTVVGTIIAKDGIWFATTISGPGTETILNGRALSLAASTTMANTIVTVPGAIAAEVVLTGSNIDNETTTVTGGGHIKIENYGGAVTATQTGAGSIVIWNNTGILSATNIGKGILTINSVAAVTGNVVISYTGDHNITVNVSTPAGGTLTVTDTGADQTLTL